MDRNSRPRGGAPYVKSTVPEAQLATKELHVDGLVVVKIVKNAHENPDCTGTLVGLDHEDHLEVTNCFPLASERSDMYVHDMLKLLREVKIDNYNLGWYMSSPLNTFYNEQFVQTMLTYQKETAGSAAIVYDPVSASLGTLYLKAFRLSDKFMQFMAGKKKTTLTAKDVAEFKLSHANLLEEIPIKIHNNELSKALLLELAEGDHGASSFEKLDLSVNPFLEKQVETVQVKLDGMIGEMARMHDYLKNAQQNKQKRMKWLQERKATNRERKKSGLELLPEDDSALDLKTQPEPSRLNALLVTKQISSYCDQINSYMTNSKIKLDVARTLQDSK